MKYLKTFESYSPINEEEEIMSLFKGKETKLAEATIETVLKENEELCNKVLDKKDTDGSALKEIKRLCYNALSKAKVNDPTGWVQNDVHYRFKKDKRSFWEKLAANPQAN